MCTKTFSRTKSGKAALCMSLLFAALVSVTARSEQSAATLNGGALSLSGAVQSACANDPWLLGNQHTQDSLESLSLASGTLPDPEVSLGIANMPTDTFDFAQDSMTQFKVGVSQVFPRGDSLDLKRKQLKLMGSQYPFQRQDRRGRVAVTVANLWLDAYKAQESIALIERDRSLFEQLADVAQAGYAAALGGTRQQDIVRAQLELTRLDDRLAVLNQQREVALQRLAEWRSVHFLPPESSEGSSGSYSLNSALLSSATTLDRQLPDIVLLNPELYIDGAETDPQLLYQYISGHAVVKGVERKIAVSRTAIELAEQKYKPEWGVTASYGYRDRDSRGIDRADFFSVGVSFDLPFFTGNKQDRELQSAVSQTEAVRTEKWLLLRKLMASFEAYKVQLLRLDQRRELYFSTLLPQMHVQAEASLTAYTNNDGDFSEVVRARIAELNANIDALSIDVDRQKVRAHLNYFFMTNADEIIASRPLASLQENQHE